MGWGWPGLDEPFGVVVSVDTGDDALAEFLHHEVDRVGVPASVNVALVFVAVDRFEDFDRFVDAGRDRVGVDVDLIRFEVAASVGVEVGVGA